MKHFNAPELIAVIALSTWANGALAHDGHSMPGAHWHATDTWGLVAVAGLVALAIWRSGGDQ